MHIAIPGIHGILSLASAAACIGSITCFGKLQFNLLSLNVRIGIFMLLYCCCIIVIGCHISQLACASLKSYRYYMYAISSILSLTDLFDGLYCISLHAIITLLYRN